MVRSATNADLLSGNMINPLVLSRQPCITPGAGHSLGKGLAGSGGGGGGVDVGGGRRFGSVVNGSDWASLNRAQPLTTSSPAHSATNPHRTDRRNRMSARLRTPRRSPPCRPAHGPDNGEVKASGKVSRP
ncbi:hypothetical protein MFM001_28180 [Mycobacterium sp. MFM001]|nr:hypothetical protein MFM001_28180 [Mycobacterium sp. MFM001]